MTKKGPTISAHKVRLCLTCQRQLPRRAYRVNCASCIKTHHGYQRIKVSYDRWRTWQLAWVKEADDGDV